MWKANNNVPIAVPGNNVEVLEPALETLAEQGSWKDLLMLLSPSVLQELAKNNAFRHRQRIRKCLGFIKTAKRLIASDTFRFVQQQSKPDTVWYFFWGRGWADILPFIPKPSIRKIAVKMHGYDLYLERNNGYIPFRDKMFNKADLLLAISENGKVYLQQQYNQPQSKVLLSRLGTVSAGLAKAGSGDRLNLVSCFGIVGVKRMERIIDSLRMITDIPVRWTHIGTGAMMDEMKAAAASLPPNIEVEFVGKLKPVEVLEYYLLHPTDLFINTSESEGVPVSIMEAFSAGIPVMATAVGGTAEIVDDSVGKLLPPSPTTEEIAAAIREFHELPDAEKTTLRQRAFQRYSEQCDAREWAKHLQQLLQINS
jgi:glycosyltransferase involved in cell wall biosynthesis